MRRAPKARTRALGTRLQELVELRCGLRREERGVWTGFVYKNTRTGEAYTETQTGFDTAPRGNSLGGE